MSAGDDNVFTRWSRRKQVARFRESPAPDKVHAPDAGAAETIAEPAEQQPAAEELDAEALPRLEDLTAESDLSAFLRKGVPKALKSAALRKMWSLDPAIRDYVGPSEYAWDFNQPGSMAGFGALDAKKTVVDFLSTAGRGLQTDETEATAASNALEAQPPQRPALSPEREPEVSPDDSEDALPESAQSAVNPRPVLFDQVEPDAEPRQASGPAESAEVPARPRHGGAMPR
jgi:hypothetical protein